MGSNRNEHEYRGIEKIRQAIYDIDPYHLFIGSATCGNICECMTPDLARWRGV
jgi:hypothetical protein